MNTDFDYYDFLKKKSFKYDVKVDLSGINLQGDAATTEVDPDSGEVSEVNLNETVDENVNYVYRLYPDQSIIYPTTDLNSSGAEIETTEIRFDGQNVVEVDNIDFETSDNPVIVTVGTNNTIIPITPRHTLIMDIDGVDDGIEKRSAIVDRDVYAALGLWNTNNLNVKSGMNITDRHAAGFLNKNDFYTKLNALHEKIIPLGIEIITNEYRLKEENDVDINISHLPYNRNFNFNTSIDSAQRFIARKNLNDELLPVSSDAITPFNMSIKDVFTTQFASAEELNGEFIGRITSLVTALTSNPIIYSAVNLDRFMGTDPTAVPTPVLVAKYESLLNYTEVLEYARNELGIDISANSGANAVAGFLPEEEPENKDASLKLEAIYTGSAIENNRRIPIVTDDSSEVIKYEIDSNPYGEEEFKRAGYQIYETYTDVTEDDVKIVRFMYENGDPTGKKIIKHTIEYNDAADISDVLNLVENLEDMMGNIKSVAALTAVTGGAFVAALVMAALRIVERRFDELDYTVKRIRWFQKYTNQSVFNNGGFIYESRLSRNDFKYNTQLSRVLIPVDFGTKKVKYKKKNFFGFSYNAYRRIDLGVRWVEVSFIDTSTFSKYRKNDTPAGKSFILNIPFESLNPLETIHTLSSPISSEIMDRDPETVNITISGADEFNGNYLATIIDDTNIQFNLDSTISIVSIDSAILNSMLVPLKPTEPENDPENIRVTYNIPHLPFDDELRDKIFNDFGPFDQSEYSNKSRSGDYTLGDTGKIIENDDISGWEIFKDSSKEISAMRKGIDVYNKVEFLVKILQDEFGKSRVNIIETSRSLQDQDYLQLGGNISSFLSWHNYGLAIKIVITQQDGITPIKDDTSDQMRLLNIAEGFCEGASSGAFGVPMNVIWCGQLVTGPDLFDWEFLPIGVGHKDALKFRESSYQQKDPIVDNSYVNVTANNYIIESTEIPDDGSPYILSDSKGINNGILINGEYWVHPKYIINYSIPSELILKDIQEFMLLIKGKMNANGTTLTGRKKISEWKSKNPRSFIQLVLFYGLTGSMSTTRKLLSGDYIEKFQNIVNTLAEKDPVKFVQRYLGDDEYANIKIYLEDLSDSSYINLNDGTLTTPVLDARSSHPEGSGNIFGQKQIDYNSVEFGQFQNGVFIPEDDDRIIEIKTTEPVIDGYVDGIPYESDAVLLHTLIANQIVDEFNTIKKEFNTLSIKFMHDKFYEGSNSSLANLLENEFGVIKTQDIMTFDALRKMYNRIAINSKKTDVDGGVRGAGANIEAQNETDDVDRNKIQSVFEKLISNSQLTGIKRASLTREKPIIEQLANEVKVEDVIEDIQNRRIPKVSDIL